MRISSVVAVARVSHRHQDAMEGLIVSMAAMKPTVVSYSDFSFTFTFTLKSITTNITINYLLRVQSIDQGWRVHWPQRQLRHDFDFWSEN